VRGDGPRLALSTGQGVAMPAPASLDCDALRRKLAEIDATGYRGARPRPAHDGDMPMLDYENRVSTLYYAECESMRRGEASGLGLFEGGFQRPVIRLEAKPPMIEQTEDR